MTQTVQINAAKREETGKGGARRARARGLVPGIIYGAGKEDIPIQIPANDFGRELSKGGFFTKLFDVVVDGEKHHALVRDVQFHRVKDLPEHVDFMRVTNKTRITLEIPVHIHGQEDNPGLRAGGVLNIIRHAIEVNCLAGNIPAAIDVNLGEMEVGDSLKFSDITLPEGVLPTITDRDFTILQVATPKIIEEEEPTVEGEEGEEGEDGETPEGEEGAAKEESSEDGDDTKGKKED